MGERDAASARLHEVDATLRRIIKDREDKKDKAVNMSTKIKKLYKHDCVRPMSVRATELSKLLENVEKLTDEVKAKDLELYTMKDLVESLKKLRDQAS